MKLRGLTTIILIASLALGAQASPIGFGQIGDAQDVKLKTAAQQSVRSDDQGVPAVSESLDQPDFVRLSDGRLIPYGPGVICSESCVEGEVIEQGFNRKWLIAIPIVAGVVIGFWIHGSRTSPPTSVAGVNQPPTSTPTPTPTPSGTPSSTPTPPGPTPTPDQPQPVPEPGTMLLLGAGLAALSHKRLKSLISKSR